MKDFIQFLSLYWRDLLWVFGLILTIVFCLIRKKPVKVVDSIKDTIIQSLPYYINKAEKEFGSGNGSKKLDYVVQSVLKDLLDLEPGIDVAFYYGLIIETVEKILSTPQKKGD